MSSCVTVQHPPKMFLISRLSRLGIVGFCAFTLAGAMTLLSASLAAQSQTHPAKGRSAAAATQAEQHAAPQSRILGTVVDKNGALAVGAKIRLTTREVTREVVSNDNGEYAFSDVPPGPFHLTVTAPGFNQQQFSGELQSGQAFQVPPIALSLSGAVTEVRVGGSPAEVAEVEVKQQLEQRVLGFVPNFYVAYSRDPAPLFPKQKFKLAYRSVIDPVTFLGVAFLAGIQQAADQYHGYGQGAAGYGRRFGEDYGDVVAGTFIGSAILPSILHQDPRYFYQGTGSKKSRVVHALENAVVARNDRSKKWEPNYSNIIGSFAAAGISYSYSPGSDRNTSAYLENALIRVGESSVAGLVQEFVLRKFTSHAPRNATAGP